MRKLEKKECWQYVLFASEIGLLVYMLESSQPY